MTTFTHTAGIVWMNTSAGSVKLSGTAADDLLELFRREHDEALRAGDRMAARTCRSLYLNLSDALKERDAHWDAEPFSRPIPRLEPITVQVREINPEIWGDAA